MTRRAGARAGADQLALLGVETGRDDHIEVIVCDHFGRVVDVIPAHLGDRHVQRDRCSLHEATLWGVLAATKARELLPPPPWWTFPIHDRPATSAPS